MIWSNYQFSLPFLINYRDLHCEGLKGNNFGRAVILVAGIIFHLQGQSIIGPQTSFMYSNPDWVSYGMQIVIAGIIIIIIGLALLFVKFKR